MKNSSIIVLCFVIGLIVLIVPVFVSAQQSSGSDATSGLQDTGQQQPGAQSMPMSIRIRSDAPLPDPAITPVMVPMPGMASGYSMPMGMGSMAGYAGTDPYLMNSGSMSGMSGMGMGMCPMMSMMGGMGMSGMGMGYGMTGYPNSSQAWTGYVNGSYPYMGSGMMGYGGYPGSYGINNTYPMAGSGMMGYGMPGYGMMGYGYNGTAGWSSGPMMGQGGFAGGYGMTGGGWGGYSLPFYGILYGVLVLLLILSWTIVGIMATVYLMRTMPARH